MILTAMLAVALHGQPAPEASGLNDLCRSVSEAGVAQGRPPLPCAEPEASFEGEPTLEVCLTRPGAGRHSACGPILRSEAELAPAGLFDAANQTPPARLQGWLGAVCAPDRLAPGQDAAACRAEAEARLERARAARVAMTATLADGFAEAEALGGEVDLFGTGIDMRAGLSMDIRAAEAETPEPPAREERCRRREDSWRDEDSGDSSASYSITCSWSSGDVEDDARAEEMLRGLLDD